METSQEIDVYSQKLFVEIILMNLSHFFWFFYCHVSKISIKRFFLTPYNLYDDLFIFYVNRKR